MTSRSRKNKGRRAVAELRRAILERFSDLQPDDIIMTPTSVGGEDLHLSPAARKHWPLCTEVKCQEKLNIWAAIEQAIANSTDHDPAVVFKRNHHPLWVAVPLDTMLEIVAYIK